jgi:hypothetical protein
MSIQFQNNGDEYFEAKGSIINSSGVTYPKKKDNKNEKPYTFRAGCPRRRLYYLRRYHSFAHFSACRFAEI